MKFVPKSRGLAAAFFIATMMLAGIVVSPASACGGNACSNPTSHHHTPPKMKRPAIGVTITGGAVGVGEATAAGKYTSTEAVKTGVLDLDAGIHGHTDACPGGCGAVGAFFTGKASEKIGTKAMASDPRKAQVGNSMAARIDLSGAIRNVMAPPVTRV
jgi:hypothetical protein